MKSGLFYEKVYNLLTGSRYRGKEHTGGEAHWVLEWMLLRDARSADFSLAKKLQLEDKNSLRNFLVMDKKVL